MSQAKIVAANTLLIIANWWHTGLGVYYLISVGNQASTACYAIYIYCAIAVAFTGLLGLHFLLATISASVNASNSNYHPEVKYLYYQRGTLCACAFGLTLLIWGSIIVSQGSLRGTCSEVPEFNVLFILSFILALSLLPLTVVTLVLFFTLFLHLLSIIRMAQMPLMLLLTHTLNTASTVLQCQCRQCHQCLHRFNTTLDLLATLPKIDFQMTALLKAFFKTYIYSDKNVVVENNTLCKCLEYIVVSND